MIDKIVIFHAIFFSSVDTINSLLFLLDISVQIEFLDFSICTKKNRNIGKKRSNHIERKSIPFTFASKENGTKSMVIISKFTNSNFVLACKTRCRRKRPYLICCSYSNCKPAKCFRRHTLKFMHALKSVAKNICLVEKRNMSNEHVDTHLIKFVLDMWVW